MTMLDSRITPSAIPLAQGWDQARLDQLKRGNSVPMEVVVKIAPGNGSHGYYTESALQKLVAYVTQHTLAGYRGHVRGEELPFRFDYPSTPWIGALWHPSEHAGYFRGVVDQREPDLKRLIRAGRITQPSILYTEARTERVGGETRIVDLGKPLSLDWAPFGRAGMSTAEVVGWSEQDGKTGTRELLFGEILLSLRPVKRDFPWGDVSAELRHDLPFVRVARAEPRPWSPPAGLVLVERAI